MWLTQAHHLRPDGTFGVADIGVEDGRIVELAPAGSQRGGIDCQGHVLLPGLVNGHYHSQATLLRGQEAGLDLTEWFGDSPGGRLQARIGAWLDDPANRDAIATVIRHEYLTLLRQGVTFIADSGVSEIDPSVLAGVGDEIGLRALPQAYDDDIEHLDPARFTVHIESEEDLTAEVLDRSVRYRDEFGPVFGLHCLETTWRRERALADWGASTVEVLDGRGLLTPRTVLFHGCEMTDRDVELVARRGAAVMHCPVSNLALHGRIPPAVAWRRAGVTMGLGTDWGDTDMWGTVRTAWLLQQGDPDRAARPTPGEVLRMATRGGAVGYARDDLGEIAPGRTADLVFLDASRLRPYAHRADVSTLGFAVLNDGGANLVRHVMVGGEFVLRDGEPTRVDATATAARYHRIAADLVAQPSG
ncbi:MAG: amidohydrolase family protein [Actinocatenispora sp.]